MLPINYFIPSYNDPKGAILITPDVQNEETEVLSDLIICYLAFSIESKYLLVTGKGI